MARRGRASGLNHTAPDDAHSDAAPASSPRGVDFELRGRAGDRMAFIDLGDQFLALSAGRREAPDDDRHLGLVVDDADAVRRALGEVGVALGGGRGLRFRDPWGNQVEVVQYDEVQFTKAPGVLRGMGLEAVAKTPAARDE